MCVLQPTTVALNAASSAQPACRKKGDRHIYPRLRRVDNCVAMRYVFDDLTVNVLCEFYRSLCSARGAHPTAFAGECDKERVLTPITVYPCSTVSEESAIEVLVECLYHLIPQAAIVGLKPGLPLDGEVVPRVVDDLVEVRGFRRASPVVLERILCLFPRVAPEHAD